MGHKAQGKVRIKAGEWCHAACASKYGQEHFCKISVIELASLKLTENKGSAQLPAGSRQCIRRSEGRQHTPGAQQKRAGCAAGGRTEVPVGPRCRNAGIDAGTEHVHSVLRRSAVRPSIGTEYGRPPCWPAGDQLQCRHQCRLTAGSVTASLQLQGRTAGRLPAAAPPARSTGRAAAEGRASWRPRRRHRRHPGAAAPAGHAAAAAG